MSRQQIIEKLGGRSLGEIIPAEFLARFNLSPPGQYGMVCANVAAERDNLEALGATPFIHTNTEAPGWVEQGTRRKVQVDMAMGYTDGEQIELLGPGTNTNFYRDAIPADGSLTLHHVCCMQNNLDELKVVLPDAGYPLYLEGGVDTALLSTHFAYFDAREELGVWLEIAQYRLFGKHRPPTEKFITRLAKLQRLFRR